MWTTSQDRPEIWGYPLLSMFPCLLIRVVGFLFVCFSVILEIGLPSCSTLCHSKSMMSKCLVFRRDLISEDPSETINYEFTSWECPNSSWNGCCSGHPRIMHLLINVPFNTLVKIKLQTAAEDWYETKIKSCSRCKHVWNETEKIDGQLEVWQHIGKVSEELKGLKNKTY